MCMSPTPPEKRCRDAVSSCFTFRRGSCRWRKVSLPPPPRGSIPFRPAARRLCGGFPPRRWPDRSGYPPPIPAKPNRTATPRIPDGDRHWLAIGASYRPAPAVLLAAGYTHIFLREGHIDLSASGPGETFRGDLRGRTRSSIDGKGSALSARPAAARASASASRPARRASVARRSARACVASTQGVAQRQANCCVLGWARAANNCRTGACSSFSPWRITITSSAISATTALSCVMKITATPGSARKIGQPHDGARCDRFTRPLFAHNGQRLTRMNIEAD